MFWSSLRLLGQNCEKHRKEVMQIKTNRQSGFSLLGITFAVVIVGLLAAIVISNFVVARERAQLNSIVTNLRITEGAKEQWRIDHKKATGDTPSPHDLGQYCKDGAYPPATVVGEIYNINAIGITATAKIPVRLRKYSAGSVVTIP
ncbi:MAG: hypothetical protein A3B25_03385 [Candidatus Ryanbacteria bacterium RIFCSPLOWO2_01_FULL_48_26]|uniref:Type II secretion system protein GspG C-terminal domain-containing protein n=1 Tax=Candidatus Ryanbacteria bacterium RIFCSPLOWO2_01_FULL_48_26 TaxID=1802126 RepID=A0A1G2GS78_9BACT|nr:MAG: hypothetical protein A3B25_03385 [Candidatus Ryanbacteria bacterium RIFCSPLOWO2_01_FULL_48_26]